MELNKKCLAILRYLREQDDYVSIKKLAELYNLSDRAIRYNIDKIEKFLLKNGFLYLEKRHQKGVKLLSQNGLNEFIDRFTNEDTPYQYAFSKEERFRYITAMLLQVDKALNTSFFEKKLCVSKNTVLKEVETIQDWLKNKGLTLVKKPRIGIYVRGKELDKRKALIEVLSQTVSTQDIFNYLDRKVTQSKINNLQLDTLFSKMDIDFLDTTIRKAEYLLGNEFSDEAYGNLVTHLVIMVKRIQLMKKIYLPPISMAHIQDTKEFDVAMAIRESIEEHYSIQVPMSEVKYIAIHFLGAKVLKHNDKDNQQELNTLVQVIATMVNEIEKIYSVDFGERRDDIIKGLLVHLRPTMYRVKYSLKLENPLLDEIMMNYHKLFNHTSQVVRHFEDYVGHKMNDHEIAYVVLHFGAALVRLNKRLNEKARIILVCGSGIGTAKMIASQIDKQFNVDIVDTISSRAVATMKYKRFDFIISTVDIPGLEKDKYIKISPLLLKKDYDRLKQHLQIKYPIKEEDYTILGKVNQLIKIVEKQYPIKDKNHLQYEFLYVLQSHSLMDTERRYLVMLNDLLPREMIKLNIECEDWVEVIKKGASLLEAKGYVEESYSETIIKNFREIGPYMVVAPGIVLSHARPEDGVNKLSMSLMTLKKPVKFGSDYNDPVKLVITLAATDNETHLKALSQLMTLFMNAEDLKLVMQAHSKEEIINIINKYSK